MDILGMSTSGVGLLVVAILVWIAASKKNLAQIYQNVIYLSLMLSSLFTVVVGALRIAGAGSIILPLTSLVGMGLIGVVGIYSEKAKPFKGVVSPLHLSAVVGFLVAISVIGTGVVIGLRPYLDWQEASVLAAAAGLADSARGAAINTLLLLLTPLFTAAIQVITNLATRDAGSEV